jgi:PKD repeat protein
MKILKISAISIWLMILSTGLNAQNVSGPKSPGFKSDTACQAAFSCGIDSLTSFPFYYHFKDLSTGNINAWYWDFGDGSSSPEQNPSHQYAEAGTYRVCLTAADQNDTSSCLDQVCQNITTLEYFSLGGLVYAGEYPLNNPVIAGDTGVASLYRIVNDQITFVEDQYFQEYGYYWFGYLFPGDYMLKISLTKGSTHYHDYFTTYYGDEISWTKAGLLTISDASFYDAEIHLKPVQELVAGQGIIRGYVKFEQGNLFSMPPISQTNVILSDINHSPLLFTQPNDAGYFEFSGIAFDTYLLKADATGKPASTVTIILSENTPVVEGINLTVFGSNVNFIPEDFTDGLLLTSIYPNPVKETLHIRVFSSISAPVFVNVTDVTGKSYCRFAGIFETGFNQMLIPTSFLPAGVYLLILQPQGNYVPVTAKFIK